MMKNNYIYALKSVSLLLCLLLPVASYAQETPENQPEQVIAESNAGSEILVDEKAGEQESETIKFLKASLESSGSPALKSLVLDKSMFVAGSRVLALKALEKNLSIERSKIWREVAGESIEEARAYFDPVFNLSVNYTHSEKNKREVRLDSDRRGTTNAAGVETGTDADRYIIFEPNSPIEYLYYDQPRRAGYYPETTSAWNKLTSNDIPYLYEPDESATYNININQRIPWGPNLNLALTTVESDSRWILFDKSDWGHYDRPWKSTLTATLSLPLPFTRNFGEYSWADSEVERTRLDEKQAYWEVKSTINNTLLTVGQAYWDLVYAVKSLEASISQRQRVEKILEKTQFRYDERLATEYDLAQTKSRLASAKDSEVQSWKNLLTASNVLGDLLDIKEEVLILPSGYEALMGKRLDGLTEQASSGIKNNPELRKQAVMIKSADLIVKQRDNYTRPDLQVTAAYTSTQASSVYGYRDLGESLGDVFLNSDKTSSNFTFNYGYQLFNKGPEAMLVTSKHSRDYQQVDKKRIELSLRHDLADGMAQLVSAESRIGITEQNLKLANTAYEKALALRDDDETTEYEVLTKNIDVLAAELRYVRARVEMKKAEVSMLHALGVLPEVYADVTAQTDFDRHRIHLLRASKKNKNIQEGS
ncbi:TolC family protein [Maridesulfovibrio sp.]|uniref:TolC family protein n=1 Tax=Maridesulfovibrio sp. TaxID=2795000 RepID=UPI002AA752A1|nr:TolC family protein [Maridesulfovibrio sp.]